MSLQAAPVNNDALKCAVIVDATKYPEYQAVKKFYAGKRAMRSGQPLMKHIEEGVEMMARMRASEVAMKAFCLHPLLQNGSESEMILNWDALKATPGITLGSIHLATAYRYAANNYLCRPETDHYTVESLRFHVGYLSLDLVHMLAADKIQNEQDFNTYHKGTHPRSAELSRYFEIWLDYLEDMDDELRRVQ